MSTKNPLISVIIPVYNHAHTLRRCLESVCDQIYRPLEVVVVNDGSTDNFEEVINKLQVLIRKLPNFQVINQRNLGSPAARNRGFQASQGDYVIFWDADTIAKPNMLEKMLIHNFVLVGRK